MYMDGDVGLILGVDDQVSISHTLSLQRLMQVVIKGSELQLPFQACLKMEKLGDRILRCVR
jgi:hypothetical protein